MKNDRRDLRLTARIVAMISLLGFSSMILAQHLESPLQLRSSDAALVHAFDWAKGQALSYVREGDPVGPWYEAALPGRQAFCMRDISHQAAGGVALGLSEHTFNMFRKFAANISESRDWCTFWEIDRLDRPAPVDYKSDKDFWWTLPASFDVLDACYRMYGWTHDRRYIDDPVMLNFYRHTMTDYVAKWDLSADRIMERDIRIKGARGIPSYVETVDDISVGVDLLASESAACRAYAAILDLKKDAAGAEHYRREAAKLDHLIDSRWWNPSAKAFYGFYTTGHEFTMGVRWSLLYWDAIRDPAKLKSAVKDLADIPLERDSNQVEDKSYQPEILYRFGYTDKAYRQILDLAREDRHRREYPEVSFAMIGAICRGMMGVTVEPTGNPKHLRIRTVSGLGPKTNWAELSNLPVLGTQISLRQEAVSTTLTNQGTEPMHWRAAFVGKHTRFYVDGKRKTPQYETGSLDRVFTYLDVEVMPGKSVRAEFEPTQIEG